METEKESIAFIVQQGMWSKRIWFAVGKDELSQKTFGMASDHLNDILPLPLAAHDQISFVVDFFAKRGFERIAK